MANKPMKSLQLPGLNDTYTFLQNDETLTQAGMAADAKVTGDRISVLEPTATSEDVGKTLIVKSVDGGKASEYEFGVVDGLTDEAKAALLDCFKYVAWINGNGQSYYDALYQALYTTPVPPEPPEPGFERVITSDELRYAFGLTVIPPDYITSWNKRATYPNFDIFVEPGKTYTVSWVSSLDTLNVSILFYNETAYNAAINQQTLQDADLYDPPWMTVSGDRFTVPATINNSPTKFIRVTCRANNGNHVFSTTDTSITSITISKVTN